MSAMQDLDLDGLVLVGGARTNLTFKVRTISSICSIRMNVLLNILLKDERIGSVELI
jgi:hypothetical protein